MAYYKIATIGNAKDNMYFELAQQLLNEVYPPKDNDGIELVDITDFDDLELEGTINGIMYFTDVHDSNNVEMLKNVLNLPKNISRDLNIYALSHETVTEKEQIAEKKKLESYVEEKFPNADIHVAPANINTEREMEAYTKGFIKSSLTPYIDFVDSIETQTKEKIDGLRKVVEDSLEFKHEYTAGHVKRVSELSEVLAKQLGCNEQEIEDIKIAAALHDIGKIIIPDSILDSSEALTYAQRQQMEIHDVAGSQLLESIAAHDAELAKKLNPEVLKAIKYHHKDWDGRHDKNSDRVDPINHDRIGKYACIIAVADCIDAMTSQRAYNNTKHILDTFRDLWSNRDKQFEPQAAEAGILVLGKAIAELGYDPVKMFSKVAEYGKNAEYDRGLSEFFNEHSDMFEVNAHPDPNAYNSLGFKLDEKGYFEFNDERAQKRDRAIGEKDEYNFLMNHRDKIRSIPEGMELPEEEVEKAAWAQVKQTFDKQDKEGQDAIERSIPQRDKEHDIPSEVQMSSKNDALFNTNNYIEATSTTKQGLRNDQEQVKNGVDYKDSFYNLPDNNKSGNDR